MLLVLSSSARADALSTCFGRTASPEEAIEACNAAFGTVGSDPEMRARISFQLGNAYSKSGQLDRALHAYTGVIELVPNSVAALINRGGVYGRLHQDDLARKDYDSAMSFDPEPAARKAVLDNRGMLHLALGQLPEALADLNGSIAVDPNRPHVYLNRSEVYEKMGRYDDAIADTDIAVKLDSKNLQALNHRCWLGALSNAQLALALSACNEALDIKPDYAHALDTRGFVHFRMADYPAALADYSAALAIDAKLASSLYMRGLTRLKTGDASGGNADITQAQAIDPKVADTYAGYGVKP
jgi:tetratricopeptide (TPR) repeat protein